MRKSLVAKVFVDKTTISFDKAFDYSIPFDMADYAFVGQRVLVPFGKGNKKRQGVIFEIIEQNTSDISKVKPIYSFIDKKPLVTDEMLKTANFIMEHTFCTFYEALKPMIPIGINVNVISTYQLKVDSAELDMNQFSEKEKIVIQCLLNSKNAVNQDKLLSVLDTQDDAILKQLCQKNIIFKSESAVRRVSDASVKMIKFSEDFDFDGDNKFTSKQKCIVDFLKEYNTASVKEACYFSGVTQAVITTLEKRGVIDSFDNEIYRTPYDYNFEGEKTEIILSNEQNNVYKKICENLGQPNGNAGLLYGVTGSGKTQVYLKVIDKVLESGKGVIVMVPEIALTPQTMNIFSTRYGNEIAVFHSAMSLGQRTDEWKRVNRGEAKIAIGTRSAIFAPVNNLGLIIMDEEQEHTYKSESTPRFHARDVAKFRCSYNKCMFLMASATPSVETFSLAKSGKIPLYTMKNRYGNVHLPKVKTVNMREEYKKGNLSIFSEELAEKLDETLKNGNQSILLLNRRGYQVFVTCPSCGNVKQCPNCSISLTYHNANNRLMCHYCGYSEKFEEKCSVCGENQLKLSGFGTQKVEQELQNIFPEAKVLRMDADTTMTRFAHEKKLSAFAAGEYDIMVGTQMVAKGLDFPNVTLVGVINADQSLYSNDFRAYEKTFSLLTQVIGRSGRGEEEGTAIIQTVSPDNEIITISSEQNYERFYDTEILSRKLLKYPPYCDLCVLGFSGIDKEKTYNKALEFFENLKKNIQGEYSDLKMIILGPSPCNVPKVSNKYRYRLILKCKNSMRLRDLIKMLLVDAMKNERNKNYSIFADINPENMI